MRYIEEKKETAFLSNCFAFSPESHPIIMLSCKQKSRDRIVWCGSLFML